MRIINIMLGRNLGGIEQAFLDYYQAMKLRGCQVINITHKKAAINKFLAPEEIISINCLSQYDLFARRYLKKIITAFQADLIITHGNRALNIAHPSNIPIIAVSHNYNLQYLHKADLVLALTKHMQEQISLLYPKLRIEIMANMIAGRALEEEYISYHPLVIGAMGRMVTKKGFDVLIKALATITDHDFKLLLGGDGPEKKALIALVEEYQLQDKVEFIGWVENKAEFFAKIDIFCVVSNHEPFGIVVLEAMQHGKLVISTESEGPREIITNRENGILVPIGEPEKLAEEIIKIIHQPETALPMIQQAAKKINEYYNIEAASNRLYNILKETQQTTNAPVL